MKEIDPYQDSPMLVAIPYKIWKELEEVMQTGETTRDSDVGTFATILCIGAVTGYIDRKKKRNAMKEKPQNGWNEIVGD